MTVKRWAYFIPVAVLAVLVMYFVLGLQRDPKILPSALLDKPVPDFNLSAIEGGRGKGFSSDDLKQGKVSIINVFASWCVPCRAEHPIITRLAEMGVADVYGLNYKDKASAALSWL